MPLIQSVDKGKRQVERLVERFHRNLDVYKRPEYKEARVRAEFIDPLFEALGWDVRNTKGYAEQYKDVVHEDALTVSGAVQAPDYCFRIGGTRKFFLEAKKPSVSVKGDVGPAYQLRRYAWSAKLPLSILTDFEEFAVYDCQRRPVQNDKASVARILYFTYDQYPDCFEEVYGIFARQSILEGSFDRYVQDTKRKRGTSEVDAEFLKEIEGWRETLARNLALRNPGLSVHELNYSVQRTIDRIIFLRMAEDRGIEPYGRLMALTNGAQIYARLAETLYRQADEKYNSGLFDFQADTLTPSLLIDDRVLKPILTGLYYPECPYEFSVLPTEVLGQVYEQFLGKVIRLTPAHRAVVEEKPEVKKAGGVYYTPSYIVDYIVGQTVGVLVEGKSPRQLRGVGDKPPLRVLDPACGSGSFLLGAYQYLLDHYLRWYEENGPEKYARRKEPPVYQGAGGDWRLTTAEKKRILLDHIYGVDIDRQAVEVTKLSLLLKVLEGETEETLGQQMTLWRERALPDLADNIKCGNSLIEWDYFEGQLSPDPEEVRRVNPFDWEREFPEVLPSPNLPASCPPGQAAGGRKVRAGGEGGFDAVIGNPPYGIVFNEATKHHLEARYPAFLRNNDTYVAFTQKSFELLKESGLFGFITPNTFILGPYFNGLKRHILESAHVQSIIDFGNLQVFQQPNVFTALLFLSRRSSGSSHQDGVSRYAQVPDIQSFPESLDHKTLDRTVLESLRWSPMGPLVTRLLDAVFCLDDIAWIKDVGLNYWTKGRGKTRGGSIADRTLYHGPQQHVNDKPYLKGRDIERYCHSFSDRWLRHDYQQRLDPTVDTLRFSPEYLEREKIVYRQTADRIIATLDTRGVLTDKTLHSVVLRDKWQTVINLHYLLGLLNSSLLSWLYGAIAQEEGRTFAQVKVFRMKKLPVAGLDADGCANVARYDRMVALVERMLELHKKLAAATIPADKALYERQIEATDREIDALVYELYGLTEEEIAIVEG